MMNPLEDGTSSFAKIYEIESDKTPDFNPEDFIEYYWLSPEELNQRLEEGDTAKGDLPKMLRKFYLS
jgi:hypothetical protein